MPIPIPTRLSSAVAGRFEILDVVREELATPAGGSHAVHRLVMPDWVAVVAVTSGGDFVLVRQYRHGVEEVTLEAAGGVVDPGETPETAGLRELAEETGYVAESLEPLGWVHPNPALQDNRCHLFLARHVREAGSLACDEHELTEPLVLDVADVRAALFDGRITHALALVALHRALDRLARTPLEPTEPAS